MKLDLGCGQFKREGYIGIDNATVNPVNNVQFIPDVIHDLNNGIPFPDNSCNEVYSSHSLEHFRDPHFILRECRRVLVNGGIICIIVPLYSLIGGHITYFYPDWFKLSLIETEFKIIHHEEFDKYVINQFGRYDFRELHINLEVIK